MVGAEISETLAFCHNFCFIISASLHSFNSFNVSIFKREKESIIFSLKRITLILIHRRSVVPNFLRHFFQIAKKVSRKMALFHLVYSCMSCVFLTVPGLLCLIFF